MEERRSRGRGKSRISMISQGGRGKQTQLPITYYYSELYSESCVRWKVTNGPTMLLLCYSPLLPLPLPPPSAHPFFPLLSRLFVHLFGARAAEPAACACSIELFPSLPALSSLLPCFLLPLHFLFPPASTNQATPPRSKRAKLSGVQSAVKYTLIG